MFSHDSSIFLITLAGLPYAMTPEGTSLVTTLPAPMIVFSPMVIPQRMMLPVPMDAPCSIIVGVTFQSLSCCLLPSGFVERGYLSLMKQTL